MSTSVLMPNTEASLGPIQPIRVSVGVIVRGSQVCISLRPKHLHKGGCWEFPGGKIELGENLQSGLFRELKEELGIEVVQSKRLMEISWDYPEKSVVLEVALVDQFLGEPRGMEGQEIRWVDISELSEYEFPEANTTIVERLQLQL